MSGSWQQRWLYFVFVLLLSCLQATSVRAELKTHQIKAAYLYQISKFVFWPDIRKQADTFQVCQLGKDRYEGTLQKMEGRRVFDKPVSVESIGSLDQAAECHLLIISSPELVKENKLRKWLSSHQVLTVVDGVKYRDIGMVTFVLESQRVRLHINLNLTEHSGLSFAANLLEVASHIQRGKD